MKLMATEEPVYPSHLINPSESAAIYRVPMLKDHLSLVLDELTRKNSDGILPGEVLDVLTGLSEELWPDVNEGDTLVVEPVRNALTNKVYSCHWMRPNAHSPVPGGRSALLRIYGEMGSTFFDREEEKTTFERMSEMGMGPRLLANFAYGRVEEYLNAMTLSCHHLRDPEISCRVALKMCEFHQMDVPLERKAVVWERLRKWHRKALELSSLHEIRQFDLHALGDEINQLEIALEPSPGDVNLVFCHNDLQYGNIMMDTSNGNLTFIDYEYASYNAAEYDIANYFCEMTADYHSSTPHKLDYTKYPGYNERLKFIETYTKGQGSKRFYMPEIQSMLRKIEDYCLVSHVHWFLWGVIMAHGSGIEFEYEDYARQRLEQYNLHKKRVLLR